MKSVFVLPAMDVSVGRQFTHIDLWKRNPVNVTVCAFSRGKENQAMRQVDLVIGEIENKKILGRLGVYRKSLEHMMRVVEGADVVFVYTLDCFVFTWMAKVAVRSQAKIVFFVLDIREKFIGDSLFNQITQRFLSFAFSRCELILTSSEEYLTEYAKKYLGELPKDWMLIENKIDEHQMNRFLDVRLHRSEFLSDQKITIGYFGVMRCAQSLRVLLKLVGDHGDRYQVVLRGLFTDIPQGLLNEVEGAQGLIYLGSYLNPEELQKVYMSCDIVWGCYPYGGEKIGNHMWAKTNRFYESCFFKKPIIVSQGTRDSLATKKYDVGISIDFSDINSSVDKVSRIRESDLDRFVSNYESMPEAVYLYSNEFKELYELLR